MCVTKENKQFKMHFRMKELLVAPFVLNFSWKLKVVSMFNVYNADKIFVFHVLLLGSQYLIMGAITIEKIACIIIR